MQNVTLNQKVARFTGVDPFEDTESILSHHLVEVTIRFTGVDPFEDTERRLPTTKGWRDVRVSQVSIRLRILKGFTGLVCLGPGGVSQVSIRLRILKERPPPAYPRPSGVSQVSIRLRILKVFCF